MKRLVLMAVLVFFAFVQLGFYQEAFGQSSAIYLSNFESGYGTSADTVGSGRKIVWTMAIQNNSGLTMVAQINGFRIYSPSGASWTPPIIDTLDIALTTGSGWGTRMDGGTFYEHFTTGSSLDTIAIGSFALWGPGFEDGFDADAFTITIPLPGIDSIFDGGTICLDSSFYSFNGHWLWATEFGDTLGPDWSGPHCYTIVSTGNNAPTITSCEASLDFDHCPLAEYQFEAIDPENDTPIVYTLVSGPGSIDSLTGFWSYQPSIADVGAALSIEVVANDPTGSNLSAYPCITALNFTNIAPILTVGCNSSVSISAGSTAEIDFDADGGDCDTLFYSINNVNPVPVGSYSIDSMTGLLSFNSDSADVGNNYVFLISVTDRLDTYYCEATFVVSCCSGNRGDINNDGDDATILDLTYLVDFIFRGGPPALCDDEADVNNDGNPSNILDLTYLVDFIFRGGPAPNPC